MGTSNGGNLFINAGAVDEMAAAFTAYRGEIELHARLLAAEAVTNPHPSQHVINAASRANDICDMCDYIAEALISERDRIDAGE